MIQIPLLDELRAIRRRLSEQCQGDMERYARMLQETKRPPGMKTRSEPFLPPPREYPEKASA
jgi:hypothetical protein